MNHTKSIMGTKRDSICNEANHCIGKKHSTHLHASNNVQSKNHSTAVRQRVHQLHSCKNALTVSAEITTGLSRCKRKQLFFLLFRRLLVVGNVVACDCLYFSTDKYFPFLVPPCFFGGRTYSYVVCVKDKNNSTSAHSS